MLTARPDGEDWIRGLDAGADDCPRKPFDIEKVVARLRALVRRARTDLALPTPSLQLDPTERTVAQDGTSVTLTPTEFRLLGALAGRRGKSGTRAALIGTAWPHGAIVHDNTLDAYIASLRRRLRSLPDPRRS